MRVVSLVSIGIVDGVVLGPPISEAFSSVSPLVVFVLFVLSDLFVQSEDHC